MFECCCSVTVAVGDAVGYDDVADWAACVLAGEVVSGSWLSDGGV